MKNRRQRRAMRARADKLYEDYLRHLPKVPLDQPLERGRVHHLMYFHDDRCGIWERGECTCNPTVERRVEPVRS
jgi:hypothetical protein